MNALHLTPRKEELGGIGGCDNRYGSVMRQSENLSVDKVQASSQENIESFMMTERKDFGRQGLSIIRREFGT